MIASSAPDRISRFTVIGACLGLLCPIGWFFLRFVFFNAEGLDLFSSVTNGNYQPAEHLALTLYMGLGTAAVFALFGRYLSLTSQAIQERAQHLDELNQTIAEQKQTFETRYRALDSSLKNFHITNARIQRSIDTGEVFRLAAECLHEILGYDRVNILMKNADNQRLEFVASRGVGEMQTTGTFLPLDERAGVLWLSMRENRIYLVDDMRKAPHAYRLRPPCDNIEQLRSRTFIICPIVLNGESVGLFGVDNKSSQRPLGETDVEAVRLFADQVATALNRIHLVQGVETLIGELHHTFAEVSSYRNRFADLVRSLKTGSAATSETIARIVDSAEVVRAVVDDTSSATTEISVAIEEVNSNFEKLQEFMEQSIATITQITATARQVEYNAAAAYEMSETVQVNAESGARSVRDAFAGLQGISRAVDESQSVIEELSVKSREIDRIIDVISEINQKTNLLSLNAAIIAAQAGEQGRSFSVVAEEIRSLSRETEQSAGAIAGLVKEIQQRTELAVQNIGATRRMVDRDITLGRTTGEALQLILDSAERSMKMSSEIRKSTAEQVRGSQNVARSVEELGGMSGRLMNASREQSKGIQRIVRSVMEIRQMSNDMVAATAQQNAATLRIDREVDQVNDLSGHIFEALAERQNESYRVIEQLDAVKRGGTKA